MSEPCRDRSCRSHAALERARAIAVALEQENAQLRAALTAGAWVVERGGRPDWVESVDVKPRPSGRES